VTELLIRDCLALCEPGAPAARADILVRNGTVEAVAPPRSIPEAADIVDGARLLVAPGLINGHTHSHENFTKGRYENLPLELWMNFVRPPDPIPLTARQVYLRTMIGAIEALRTGATTIVDDVNIFPILEPAHLEAVLQAYEDIGIRAVVCPGLFDKPFFDTLPFVRETFPKETLAAMAASRSTPPEDRLAHVAAMLDGRHPREARVSMAISPSAPQRCTDAFLMRLKRLADDHDLPMIIHVQETRLQVVSGRLFYGRTMVEHLDALGFLRPGVSLIHGVWLNPGEIEIIARSGASVQHNPVSNMAIGSGLAPVRDLLEAGVNVSLGTDACGSSFTTSMIKTVNATALTQKLRGDDHEKWITAREAWAAGTTGGARALGLDGVIGAIRPGLRADLVGWSLDGWAFRPLNDPLRQLVYAATGAELSLAVVNGEVALRDGRLVRIDEDAIWREIDEAHGEIAERLALSDSRMAPLVSPYGEIHARCLAEAIAEDTFEARFNTHNCGCRCR
jgi:guanine deaminase